VFGDRDVWLSGRRHLPQVKHVMFSCEYEPKRRQVQDVLRGGEVPVGMMPIDPVHTFVYKLAKAPSDSA